MRAGLAAIVMLTFGAALIQGQDAAAKQTTIPKLVKMVKAVYTPEGRTKKIQGIVVLSAIVLPNGTVSDVNVTRSLDTTFGLDEQAVIATKQCLFEPGTIDGKPVSVQVSIEQGFYLNSTK